MPDAVLAAISEAVYVIDERRTITYWNPAAERLTGYPASEVVGRRCRDGILNHVDASGRMLCVTGCPLLATMRDGQTRKARVFLHHREGHRVPVEVSAAPMYGPDGIVVGAVEAFHDDSPRREIEQRLDTAESAALIDPLTGVGNRRLLLRALERHESGYLRHQEMYAVLFLDVDNFKVVNDGVGHDVGDRVLQLVARTIEGCVRPVDTVGRWGGDEFLVIAPVDGSGEALALAERLRAIAASAWLDPGRGRVRITLSIGVSTSAGEDTSAAVVKRADAALHAAKAAGRDCVSAG
jgi:diguanylate cyclase (GGDEF)-like protein/PAS domain S-box-containing protein